MYTCVMKTNGCKPLKGFIIYSCCFCSYYSCFYKLSMLLLVIDVLVLLTSCVVCVIVLVNALLMCFY
jgi:hypothetical protein